MLYASLCGDLLHDIFFLPKQIARVAAGVAPVPALGTPQMRSAEFHNLQNKLLSKKAPTSDTFHGNSPGLYAEISTLAQFRTEKHALSKELLECVHVPCCRALGHSSKKGDWGKNSWGRGLECKSGWGWDDHSPEEVMQVWF